MYAAAEDFQQELHRFVHEVMFRRRWHHQVHGHDTGTTSLKKNGCHPPTLQLMK